VRPLLEVGGVLLRQLGLVGATGTPAGPSAPDGSSAPPPEATTPAAQVTPPAAVEDTTGGTASTDLVVRVESRPGDTEWSVLSPHVSSFKVRARARAGYGWRIYAVNCWRRVPRTRGRA
jgi:hypothetical protein